ncbi:MAG: peptide/nickel transport system permease protein [Rhodospirillaceae bacterium]|jgi:ABC-type dipeptide/oligopeptide/nickel transport system permease component|nr:peptide/nickel transport system permease protein [Rhodospirillaceae bacterium]
MDRYAFVLRRPLQLLPVLIGISFVTFVLVQLTPGDPIRIMLGPRATESAIAAVRARYGLDQPLLVQYGYYMLNLLRADFGQSLAFRTSVIDVILQRLLPTVFLLAYGLAMSILLTLGLAIAAARSRGRWADQAVRLFCVSALGLPSFWLGLMLIILFSLRLGLFPVSGFGRGFTDNLWHLFLPALTITIAVSPILTRNLRATLISQMGADYAVAGRSKGLTDRYVFFRHVFWNSLLPTISLLGIVVSFLIGGTVVVETVFNVPGLGQLMVRAVLTRDYFVVQGVTLFFAVGVVITNFVVDMISVALDPRVKL